MPRWQRQAEVELGQRGRRVADLGVAVSVVRALPGPAGPQAPAAGADVVGLQFHALCLHHADVVEHQQAAAGVDLLLDQVGHPVAVHRAGQPQLRQGPPLDGQFGGTQGFTAQQRVGQGGVVAVLRLRDVRLAVGAAIEPLDHQARCRVPQQCQARRGTLAAVQLPVQARTQHGAQAGAQGDLVVDEQAPALRGGVDVGEQPAIRAVERRALALLQVALRFQPEHQALLLPAVELPAAFHAGPPAAMAQLQQAVGRPVVVAAGEAVLPERATHEELTDAVQRVLVLHIEEAVTVGSHGLPAGEDGVEGADGNLLAPLGHQCRHGEIAARPFGVELAVGLAVGVGGHAEVRGRRVEFGKVAVASGPGLGLRRQQQTRSAELQALRQAHLAAAVGADLDHRLAAAQSRHRFGDDVDDAEHRVRSVQRRARTRHELDALDQRDVERKFTPHGGRAVDVVVDAHAVDQHQQARRKITRPSETAHAEVAVAAVVAQVHPAHAIQRLGQRAPAVGANVAGRQHRHGRRRGGGVLSELRRGIHRLVEQQFQVFDIAGRRAGGSAHQRQPERRRRDGRAAQENIEWIHEQRLATVGQPGGTR